MHILLETTSTNPEFDGECDYAVVDMTPALVRQIRQRVRRARRIGRDDANLCELYFWCSTAQFFDSTLLEACEEASAAANTANADQAVRDWLADLDNNGHMALPEGVALASLTPQRVECSQLILRTHLYGKRPEFELAWTASPRHTDVYVTTRELPLAALDRYLRQAEKTSG